MAKVRRKRRSTRGYVAGSPKGGRRGTVRPAAPERRPGPPAGPYPGESSNPAIRRRARREREQARREGKTPAVPYAPPGGTPEREARLARHAGEDRAETRRRVRRKRAGQAARRSSVKRRSEKASAKPRKYEGRPTAGAPTLGELEKADRSGKLKVNRKGFLVTPTVGKAARQLKRAEAKAPKASHDVAGIEDPEIRRAIVKYAPRVEKLARERYGISGEALLAKTVEGESNEEQGAVSSAKAKSITQFIPSTRADFVNRFGIDPWRSKEEAVLAATMHLDGKHGYTAGLEGYNPGGGQGYVDYILGQPVGGSVGLGRKTTPRVRKARRQARAAGLKVRSKRVKALPKKVMTRFKAAMAAAKELEKAELPYVWGGGHGDPESRPTGGGLDCSGAVSYVLNKMGAMKGSLVSGDMGQVLEPGPGAVTVFYNPGHTFMRIGDRYFGTSRTNEGGGPGFIEGKPDDLSKYAVGHVPGMGKKVAVAMGVPLAGGDSFPGMTLSDSGTTAQINEGAGATVGPEGKPGFSAKPIRLTRAQRARRTFRKLEQLGAGVGQREEAEEEPNAVLAELEEKYGRAAA